MHIHGYNTLANPVSYSLYHSIYPVTAGHNRMLPIAIGVLMHGDPRGQSHYLARSILVQ